MSYNIDTWKTKKLEDLIIPLESFFKSDRKDWHPEKELDEDGNIKIRTCEGAITGRLVEGKVLVDSITISGEGSGFEMHEIIEPALKDSTGKLIASCVWEGGDSINKIIVNNGNVKWEDIEI